MVKTKPSENFRFLDKKKFDNTEIIKGGVGHTLLPNANIVIAFNSTTIFESIASKTPVIIPNFDKNKDKDLFKMELRNTNLIKIANTKSEFMEYLDQFQISNKRHKNLSKIEKEILDKYMGNNYGNSGLRLLNIIKKLTS